MLPETQQTKGNAKRASALSPQRFGRVAQRFEVPPVYPRRLSHHDAPRAFGLIPTRCCGRYQAIFFGLLFFWASKRKVTRAAAADRNARRVGGTLALTQQPETEALDPGLRRDDSQRPNTALDRDTSHKKNPPSGGFFVTSGCDHGTTPRSRAAAATRCAGAP
jgi:hypothetical protein